LGFAGPVLMVVAQPPSAAAAASAAAQLQIRMETQALTPKQGADDRLAPSGA
jgi:hypothetical protein